MQDLAWIALLHRIPAAYHSGLILATASGADVVVQSIVRLEDDFLIFRGRPAGTSDAGKLMILPYGQINYVLYPGRLNDQQILAMFGERDSDFAAVPNNLPAPVSTPQPVEAPEPEAAEPVASESAPASPEAPAPEAPAAPPTHPSKSLLLAKLRAKLAAGDVSKIAKK
jgi:hypothetical protein